MKTKLSELFFQERIEEMPDSFLSAFAVSPLPESDFLELTGEFKRLKNQNEISFTDHLMVDRSLIDVILKSSKKYANFCFVEKNKNISLTLHLSDSITSLDSDDEVYNLEEVQDGGFTVYNLIPSMDLVGFLKEKENYEAGLGDHVDRITNMVNTRIVSYEVDDIALFNFNISKSYSTMWRFFKYVKISFILFKRIKGSILDLEYKKRLEDFQLPCNIVLKFKIREVNKCLLAILLI